MVSLITKPSLQFRNSKWRIQYDGQKCKSILDWVDIWYSEVFGVANYESEINIQKLKITDPIYHWLKCKTLLEWNEFWYSRAFGVADYESNLNIQKF